MYAIRSYYVLGIASIALLLFAAALATLYADDIRSRPQPEAASGTEVVSKSYDYAQNAFSTDLPLILIETEDGAPIDSIV